MNTLTAYPDAARTIAHHTIADRVQDAHQRRTAHAVRAEQRAAARSSRRQSSSPSTPRRTFRFLHPAI